MLGKFIVIMALVLGSVLILGRVLADYDYSNTIESNWNLADKSSTINAKADYIDKFVVALNNQKLQGTHNALWLETPDNSFNGNFEALKTLQNRLQEIKTMDVSSFQYQQAIQQITAQEQGEAQNMLDVFQGCWVLQNHFFLWGWVLAVESVLLFGLLIAGAYIWAEHDD